MPVLMFAQQTQDWRVEFTEKLGSEDEPEFLHLVGYFDDIVFAEMFFVHDSVDWYGKLAFPDAELYFELEGYQAKDHLFFNEYDPEGMHTGLWRIDKNLNQYIGKWYNQDKTMDFEFILYDEFWNPDFKKDYHKTINTFTGVIDSTPIQLEIIRKHTSPEKMEWFFLDSYSVYSSDWTCEDHLCNSFKTELKLNPSMDKGQTVLLKERDEKLIIYNQDDDLKGVLSRQSEFKTKLKSSLSLFHKIIVEYPVLPGKAPSRRMDLISNRILDSLQTQVEVINNNDYSIDSRWEYFAHAWFEILYWDESFISGKWIIQRNWTEDYWAIPMNYSILENRFFNIEDQFKSEFDMSYFLEHFAQSGVRDHPDYKDLIVRNKLLNSDFKHLNFCKSGVVMSTDYDTIFGSFELMISFDEIAPYLHRKSELKKLLQDRSYD